MSTDEYVPSDDEMREAYVWLSAGDNEGAREQATEDFNRGLTRVRRDAAREALAQEPTDAEVEAAARALHEDMGGTPDEFEYMHIEAARAALNAARAALSAARNATA